jgi:prolyl 4-hydroxylase
MMDDLIKFLILAVVASNANGASYGIDCSFPIHNKTLNCGDLLGDRKSIYEEYMQGCRERYKPEFCDDNEEVRIEMNIRQPRSMVNYTEMGFTHIQAPEKVRKLLADFYETNKDKRIPEKWNKGNIYTNHWKAPTYHLSVENDELEGGGYELKDAVWNAAKDTIEEWTGMRQIGTSVYGIRVYTEGAVLSPHCDRLPLISSAIVNVAQDVDEDWPLEVYDKAGNAHNITMQPGDMILYESGSVIHGVSIMQSRLLNNIF